jgi:hypothetical protein
LENRRGCLSSRRLGGDADAVPPALPSTKAGMNLLLPAFGRTRRVPISFTLFDSIAACAYELWRASGCAHGNDKAHWFQAERQLGARTTLH